MTKPDKNSSHRAFYRPDIDGLRAIAVIAVVAYHANIPGFAGGFVGVDVFFVISGYLITSIILKELRTEQFSFINFYFRRIRRILPALYSVLGFTLVTGFFLSLPPAYAKIGQATSAIAIFISNHEFWKNANDYWEQSSLQSQPLLHTWSLAVEEQFYIVLPILLLLLFLFCKKKYRRESHPLETSGLIFILLIISFAYNIWFINHDPAGAFYFLPARAWEMLFGSLLASTKGFDKTKLNIAMANILSFAGLLLICWGIFSFNHGTIFPGWNALFPCLGSVLLIYSGGTTENNKPLIAKFLSLKPVVFIGLISYSFYLWHWPILVFFKSPYLALWEIQPTPIALQLVIIFIISALSWRYIEGPFRHLQANRKKQIKIVWLTILSIILVHQAGRWAYKIGSRKTQLLQPVPSKLATLLPPPGHIPYQAWQMENNPQAILDGTAGQTLGLKNLPPKFIVIGDSFASMWGEALHNFATKSKSTGLLMSYNWCPALDQLAAERSPCEILSENRLRFVENSDIPNVILANNWGNITINGGPGYYSKTNLKEKTFLESLLANTIERLQRANKRVFIVQMPPGDPTNSSPYGVAIESMNKKSKQIYSKNIKHSNIINTLTKKYNITLLDPAELLCTENKGCLLAKEGNPIYFDQGGHLTSFGAQRIIPIFEPALK